MAYNVFFFIFLQNIYSHSFFGIMPHLAKTKRRENTTNNIPEKEIHLRPSVMVRTFAVLLSVLNLLYNISIKIIDYILYIPMSYIFNNITVGPCYNNNSTYTADPFYKNTRMSKKYAPFLHKVTETYIENIQTIP